jgi:hypothetical protein
MWKGVRLIKAEERVNLVNKVTQNPESFPDTRVLEKSSGKLPDKINQINPDGSTPPTPVHAIHVVVKSTG